MDEDHKHDGYNSEQNKPGGADRFDSPDQPDLYTYGGYYRNARYASCYNRGSPYPNSPEFDQAPPKRRKAGLFITIIILAFLGSGMYSFFSQYRVSVFSDGDGAGLSITIREYPEAHPEPGGPAVTEAPQPTYQPIVTFAPTGDGTTLNIAASPPRGNELTLQEVYKKVSPSVVNITSLVSNSVTTGTGIIMSMDGYIITNYHVISKSSGLTVMLSNDTEYSAVLVGGDETSDLAVLKIEAEGLVPAEFGDSDFLEVGDEVAAIGNPLGTFRGTFTNGIISAISRDVSIDDRSGRTMTLIQTNAALNAGNSGGPLINIYGQVVGVNTMKMSSYYSSVEGLGFAIPIKTAKPIVDELIEKGYVAGRPAIGITVRDMTAVYATYYGIPRGVVVEAVESGSDAHAKGILGGDIITAVNGIGVGSSSELNTIKNTFMAGDTVTLTVYRSGTEFNVDIVLMDQSDYS